MEELTHADKKNPNFLGQISPESFPFKAATSILSCFLQLFFFFLFFCGSKSYLERNNVLQTETDTYSPVSQECSVC